MDPLFLIKVRVKKFDNNLLDFPEKVFSQAFLPVLQARGIGATSKSAFVRQAFQI